MAELLEKLNLLLIFLEAQSPQVLVQLAPWHLLALLTGMGVLSSLGMHYLLGYGFRAYRVNKPVSLWFSVPMLVILLVSVQVLLLAYLLGSQADALLQDQLDRMEESRAKIGAMLLAPGFSRIEGGGREVGIDKESLLRLIAALTGEQYRDQLRRAARTPATMRIALGQGSTAEISTRVANEALLQLALRWLIDPGQANPQNSTEPEGAVEEKALFLPEFVEGLLGEIQPKATLNRGEWEYIAGVRFGDEVLRPVFRDYMVSLASGIAVAVLLLNLLVMLLGLRVKRFWIKAPLEALITASDAELAETTDAPPPIRFPDGQNVPSPADPADSSGQEQPPPIATAQEENQEEIQQSTEPEPFLPKEDQQSGMVADLAASAQADSTQASPEESEGAVAAVPATETPDPARQTALPDPEAPEGSPETVPPEDSDRALPSIPGDSPREPDTGSAPEPESTSQVQSGEAAVVEPAAEPAAEEGGDSAGEGAPAASGAAVDEEGAPPQATLGNGPKNVSPESPDLALAPPPPTSEASSESTASEKEDRPPGGTSAEELAEAPPSPREALPTARAEDSMEQPPLKSRGPWWARLWPF